MNERKGITFGVLLIIILITIVLAGGLGLYIGSTYYKNNQINKIDDEKDIVYTIYTLNDGNLNDIKLPYINIEGEYAEEINLKIDDRKSYYSNNEDIAFGGVHYSYSIKENILSLVINYSSHAGNSHSDIYNIDIYTGEKISNLEILNKTKLTSNDIYNKIISEINLEGESYLCYKKTKNLYDENYKETIAIDIPMFFNEEGKLNLMIDTYYASAQTPDDGSDEVICGLGQHFVEMSN